MGDRHARRRHVGPAKLERAERWFDRFGAWAVFLGRLTPVVRSFISIWCFGFAAAGWAAGHGYERLHHSTRFADYAVVAALVVAAAIGFRHLRGRRAA